jgi:hypothetical protein
MDTNNGWIREREGSNNVTKTQAIPSTSWTRDMADWLRALTFLFLSRCGPRNGANAILLLGCLALGRLLHGLTFCLLLTLISPSNARHLYRFT